jgi:UDP-galactopyranose mutase
VKAVVVGAGFAGLTAAVTLKETGWQVRVFETRSYLGGLCADTLNGCWRVHIHGPHIFHTVHQNVWDFIKRFSPFTPYVHRVMAKTALTDQLLPVPYNLKTAELLGRDLSDAEIIQYFFKDYSQKMWGLPWDQLPEEVRGRVPKRRVTADDRYFTDKYQGLPYYGYWVLFQRMAAVVGNDNITLNADADAWRDEKSDLVIYTGSVDDYHRNVLGPLPYRSLEIMRQPLEAPQKAAVINHCTADDPFTRTTDYAWFTPEEVDGCDPIQGTTEFPLAWEPGRERMYPMRWGAGEALYKEYSRLTTIGPRTILCGRLASYRYMNMDDTIGDTLAKVSEYLRTR